MTRLKQTLKQISLDFFFQICRALIAVKCLFIGISVLLVPHNYQGPTFHYLFDSVDYRVWAFIFIGIGLSVAYGILFNNLMWRVGAALSGGILMMWAWVFIFAGVFTRSPPTFLIWISAALLDIFVAVTVQPKVIDQLMHEVDRTHDLTLGN